MEFKPSNGDHPDALELRIMKDDNFVLASFQELGLDCTSLSLGARRFILEDFRKNLPDILININDFDCADTFRPFVKDGKYARETSYGESLVLEPFDDGKFRVYTRRKDNKGGTNTSKEFSSVGIEMERTITREGMDKFYRYTRVDYVKIKEETIRISDGAVIGTNTFFVNPIKESGRTLDIGSGYRKYAFGAEGQERSKGDIDVISNYIKVLTNLDEKIYDEHGEPRTVPFRSANGENRNGEEGPELREEVICPPKQTILELEEAEEQEKGTEDEIDDGPYGGIE